MGQKMVYDISSSHHIIPPHTCIHTHIQSDLSLMFPDLADTVYSDQFQVSPLKHVLT